jgi:hypothetical protein
MCPAEHDLRDRAPDPLRDPGEIRVVEHLALRDRRPRLGRDAVLASVRGDLAVLEVGMQLDLVHRRDGVRLGGEPLEMLDLEVRDADRSRAAVGVELLERIPRRDEVAAVQRRQRPVDEEEVDVVGAELLERPVECTPRVVRLVEAVVELARDPDIVAVEPRGGDRGADAVLVAVHLGGVDVAIAGLERSRGRTLGVGARADLEDAEPELRDAAAVVQLDRRDVGAAARAHRFLQSVPTV